MMRKWLAILLLVLLPLQLSWAAAGAYCQHESGAAAKHFGHHEHQHTAAEGEDPCSDPAKTGGCDSDCAACHAGFASALTTAPALPQMLASSIPPLTYWARLTSPPFDRPERPQWRDLA